MYRVVIERKNKEKFLRWFMNQPLSTRNFFVTSFTDFLSERGFSVSLANFSDFSGRFLYLDFADYLFDELCWWSISTLFFYPNSMELVYQFHPFVYWQKGKKSSYLERVRKQNSFINPSF